MANNNIEIEIKVRVENSKALIEFLKTSGEFISENHQVDEYFSPNYKDFLSIRPVAEWLRLRNSNDKCSINYKNWHFDENGKSHYCDEFETKIESADQLNNILSALNFKSIVTVDKLRKTYTYKDYEIAIDSVRSLGDFIEIEYIGKNDNIDPDKTTSEMIKFLKDLDCGKIIRDYVGYPFLLLFPNEANQEIL